MPLIKLTQPLPTVHLLTLCSPPDNRLTPALLSELSSHLDTIEAHWRSNGGGEMDPKKRDATDLKGAGAVVITSECKGFFSNGLDWEKSIKNPKFFETIFDPVMYRLMTFPLVTVAAINGHAFAGGMVLALSCDFRIMTSGRGLIAQLAFGSPLPNSFGPFLAQRIPHPPHLRDTLLARRWKQSEALQIGLLDEIVDNTQPGSDGKLLERALEIAQREAPKIAAGSWGAMKDRLYHGYIDASHSNRAVLMPFHEAAVFQERVGRDKAKL
ncbi:hypothetical protein JCM24511_01048 [Saitozyma sp. JCM 24511]|nr:hypothetical protein JCM24511_01048 [Saitozyma sp. JCM 24511]